VENYLTGKITPDNHNMMDLSPASTVVKKDTSLETAFQKQDAELNLDIIIITTITIIIQIIQITINPGPEMLI